MTRSKAVLLALAISPLVLHAETRPVPASTPVRSAHTLADPGPIARKLEPIAKKAERPRIDVAFCIDTTGSMGPFIEATKKRVWEIANGLLKGTPRPIVRMAVVAFRDRGDKYLVQKIDLTEDIDAVHTFLMKLTAGGGGDGPEHVTAGLRACVDDLSWSQGKRILKSIYLIGDAPAHVDYDDGDYHPVAKKAVASGINIHTLACSGSQEVAQWMEIARMADGQFHQLNPGTIGYASRGRITGITRGAPMPARAFTKSAVATDRSAMAEEFSAKMAEKADFDAGAAAPSVESALGDKILNSIRSDAKRKGVSTY